MADLIAHKVVAALPSPLEPDALYLVRAGAGFDLYAADGTGLTAHRINGRGPEMVLTQAQYDALSPPDPDTTYYISG